MVHRTLVLLSKASPGEERQHVASRLERAVRHDRTQTRRSL